MAAPMSCCRRALLQRFRGQSYCIRPPVRLSSSISKILNGDVEKTELSVTGWVKSVRDQKEVAFLHMNDGSCNEHLQVVARPEMVENVTYGSYVKVKGQLVDSPKDGQTFELLAEDLKLIGSCDPDVYPFKPRTHHPLVYGREYPHLRPRTNIFGAAMRIRNAATMALHSFFQQEGYLHVHTPVITTNDCEGAGEVFRVEPHRKEIMEDIKKEDEKEGDSSNPHFFSAPAFLTVSGQLHLEVLTGAFSKVYTFGPTFRAENSRDRLHLAEFYMVEAELTDTHSLHDLTEVIEKTVKHTTEALLTNCQSDMKTYFKHVAPSEHHTHLKEMLSNDFKSITYTEAIEILIKHNEELTFKLQWGDDLKKEHEKFLVSHFGSLPLFVTDFPLELKPFYARSNEDGKTAAAVDLLVPDVGELFGGTIREERYDILREKINKLGLEADLMWYLDLRRFGSAPHGGFGMGFERYLQYVLGLQNIRDTIPFPRTVRSCRL
ncbi:probable asparagine--tRNA ligase, mitochondrial [Lingula anatina]|uniref:asparagine--tRNA ligase n=1 Tax=Lingula anatina TaxID=7574 RepID=A0A1S3H3T2_LINAN|nr:probable asparagine--tRNA ligase, mitochondrial [Lingula anatina]|eukprot:XP_013380126.1 probable asparagine--tRNA ligase, mitochondrial [Lingula anatina]